ncbi:MAG: hypothetical protein IJC90_07830 [Clostridia bacterium]|nr:hypothetical protein [Clostridia bacterium]
MSDFNNNSDNQEFIKKLELLRDLEAEKPVEEMDVSLVKACVELILELRGETVNFTPEEVEEKVRKIPFVEETTTLNTPPQSVKGRSTKVKSRKILLIAAIISILIAIFATISVAFEWNIFDELKNRFGTVADTPINQEFNINSITVISHGNTVSYRNLEDALKRENIDILYPTQLPPNVEMNRIMLAMDDSRKKVIFIFNDVNFTYYVTYNQKISDDIKSVSTDNFQLKDIDFYVNDMSDIGQVQIYFEYGGNLYCINYNNKQDLIKVIENLKELQ